jgi:hypothetical protein
MDAPMTMPSGRTRLRAKSDRALLVVLCILVPSFGHAEQSVDTAKSERRAAPPQAGRAGPQATPRQAAQAGPQATPPPAARAAPTQNGPAAAIPHFIPNAPKAPNVSGAPGTVVGRGAVNRGVIGGAAKYDAKHGAVIGGAVTGRKR